MAHKIVISMFESGFSALVAYLASYIILATGNKEISGMTKLLAIIYGVETVSLPLIAVIAWLVREGDKISSALDKFIK